MHKHNLRVTDLMMEIAPFHTVPFLTLVASEENRKLAGTLHKLCNAQLRRDFIALCANEDLRCFKTLRGTCTLSFGTVWGELQGLMIERPLFHAYRSTVLHVLYWGNVNRQAMRMLLLRRSSRRM